MAQNPDLVRRALEPVILEIIAAGTSYGYEIARAVQHASGGELLAQEGTLYPALHRLEKRGYICGPRGRPRPRVANANTISSLARGAVICPRCAANGPRSARWSIAFWEQRMSQSFAHDGETDPHGGPSSGGSLDEQLADEIADHLAAAAGDLVRPGSLWIRQRNGRWHNSATWPE